jgi:heavy metal sensor kinase
MRRVPIRLRLTAVFAVVMAIVLAATGLYVYTELESELNKAVDQGLRSQAQDIEAQVRRSNPELGLTGGRLLERGQSFAQILDASGRVVDSTPETRTQPLLSPAELRRALRRTVILKRAATPTTDQARLLATPVVSHDRRLVVAVGASVEDRVDALHKVRDLMLIGGPIALGLASLAAYLLAAAALRPVEQMRRRAAEISHADIGQRLPVPPAHDEIGRLGTTLNDMLDRLDAAFTRERAFVADASHELRTPLAILKAELELALRAGRSREELAAAVESAAEETDRLAQLAEDLLVIARSDQGPLPVRTTEMAAGELFDSVRERFATRVEDGGRAIAVAPGAGRVEVVADRQRVEQALANLVDNSLRYGSGAIELAARSENGAVELHVRDAGPGFPPEFIPAAFDRFTRADASRARGGTGLGLAIVAAIATAHGGSAQVANRPEGGADVWISLPAGEVSSASHLPLGS